MEVEAEGEAGPSVLQAASARQHANARARTALFISEHCSASRVEASLRGVLSHTKTARLLLQVVCFVDRLGAPHGPEGALLEAQVEMLFGPFRNLGQVQRRQHVDVAGAIRPVDT